MAERIQPTPEEDWEKIATPERQAQVIKGTIQTVMALGLTPEQAGDIPANLDDQTANGLAYEFSGVADGETVKFFRWQKTSRESTKKII